MKPSPVPIDVVAEHYLGEPSSKSDREWRYGNKDFYSGQQPDNLAASVVDYCSGVLTSIAVIKPRSLYSLNILSK